MTGSAGTTGWAAGSETDLQFLVAAGPHSIVSVKGGQAPWQAVGLQGAGIAVVAGHTSSMLQGGHDLQKHKSRRYDLQTGCSRRQLPRLLQLRQHVRDPSQHLCRP